MATRTTTAAGQRPAGWMGIGQREMIPLGLVVLGVLVGLVSHAVGGVLGGVGYIWLAFTALPLALALYVVEAPFPLHVAVGHHLLYVSDIMAFVMLAGLLWKYREETWTSIGKRLFPEAFRWPLIFLLFLSCVSLVHAVNHTQTAIKIIEYIEFFVVVVALFADQGLNLEAWRPALSALFLGASAIAVWGLVQFMLGTGPASFVVNHFHTRAYVPFGQPNAYGGFMAQIFPLGLALYMFGPKDRSKPWLLAALALIALAIVASYSRGAEVAVLCAIAAMVVLAGWTRGWSTITRITLVGYGYVAAAFVAVTLLSRLSRGHQTKKAYKHYAHPGVVQRLTGGISKGISNYTTHQRILIWKAALKALSEHKLTGVGLGGFHYWVLKLPTHKIPGVGVPPMAHDIYLELGADLGIGGILAIVWYQWRWVSVSFKAIRDQFGKLDPFFWALTLGAFGTIVDFGVHDTVDFLIDHGVVVPLLLALGVLSAVVWKAHTPDPNA